VLAARHRAMLLIGFGAALRRSEIVSLRIGDVSVVEGRGLIVMVRHSKTDQHSKGRTNAIWANHRDPAFCAVTALEQWLEFRRGAADWSAPPESTKGSVLPLDILRGELPLFCGISRAGAITGAQMFDKIVRSLDIARTQSVYQNDARLRKVSTTVVNRF
jgi:hypothetical protein